VSNLQHIVYFVEVDRDNVLVQTLLVAGLLHFCDEYHSPT